MEERIRKDPPAEEAQRRKLRWTGRDERDGKVKDHYKFYDFSFPYDGIHNNGIFCGRQDTTIVLNLSFCHMVINKLCRKNSQCRNKFSRNSTFHFVQ